MKNITRYVNAILRNKNYINSWEYDFKFDNLILFIEFKDNKYSYYMFNLEHEYQKSEIENIIENLKNI